MKRILLAILLTILCTGFTAPEVPKIPNIQQFSCLVRNVYMEARGQPMAGKIAVARVTINRTEIPKYPSTICGVVYQNNQFSWTKNIKSVTISKQEWLDSIEASVTAYNSEVPFAATHYHSIHVNPRWGFKKLIQIGQHIFYIE